MCLGVIKEWWVVGQFKKKHLDNTSENKKLDCLGKITMDWKVICGFNYWRFTIWCFPFVGVQRNCRSIALVWTFPRGEVGKDDIMCGGGRT